MTTGPTRMRARPDGLTVAGGPAGSPVATRRSGVRPSLRAVRALGLLAAALLVAACQTTSGLGSDVSGGSPEEGELTLGRIETTARTSLVLDVPPDAADGLARVVRVDLSLAPRDAVPLQIIATPPAGSDVLPAFVEVELAWQDFLGVQPTSWGRTVPSHLPFGSDGEARRDAPVRRSLTLELEEPSARVLARTVEARPRLRPVDLRVGAVHTAGQPIAFPTARVTSLRRPPKASLAEALVADPPQPDEVFLAAAQEGESDRVVTLYALLDALAAASPRTREAIFGSLLYLTGTTNGRSEAQWRAWVARNEGLEPEAPDALTDPSSQPADSAAAERDELVPQEHP